MVAGNLTAQVLFLEKIHAKNKEEVQDEDLNKKTGCQFF